MSTQSWSTRVRHDTDATWQEWRDELITKLGALVTAGVLGADETNITPAAGARPSTNTEGGYAVYHLADSLHGTAPVYIRFGLGTNGSATAPRIQVTVGTSTNGSGVIGGTALATIRSTHNNSAQATDTTRQSWMCATAGFLGLAWKSGSGTDALLLVARTVDSVGAITATGAMVVWGQTSVNGLTGTQALRFAATAAAYTVQTAISNTALCFSPQTPTSSAVGSDNQVFVAWTITPAMAPLLGVCGLLDTDVTAGNTFSATLVGVTAHTYIALTTTFGPAGPVAANASGGLKFAFLWE